MHNVVKWPNIDFLSMFDHFTTLCMKGLSSIIHFGSLPLATRYNSILEMSLFVFPFKEKFKLTSTVQHIPTGIYMFKVNNVNTREMYKICSKLSMKTPEQRQ